MITMPKLKVTEKEEQNNIQFPESASMTFDAKSKIVTDEDIYDIDFMPEDVTEIDDDFFNDTIGYVRDGFFYLYRGEGNSDQSLTLKPGIYKDSNENRKQKYFIIEPRTEEEREEYDCMTKISTIHHTSIIDSANKEEDLLIAIPESTKIFQPQITENDDILKIIAKKALLKKNVDLDRYKDRFSNKNELFNFKQVLRSNSKLSMKIFTRGMEALKLIFTITITEKDPKHPVGNALEEPIVTGSEDTYAIAM